MVLAKFSRGIWVCVDRQAFDAHKPPAAWMIADILCRLIAVKADCDVADINQYGHQSHLSKKILLH